MNLTAFNRRRQLSRRARLPRPRLTVEPLEARNLLDGGLANVLVNDPNLDQPALLPLPDGSTTIRSRDTQSETTLVLGSGNQVIVAYNDTGSETYFNGILEGVGYSLSPNSGDSFQDLGTPPDNPYGYFSDPVLARSNSTGTIFLGTIPRYVKDGQAVSDRINVFRSVDNGSNFALPQNGAPGFVAGVDDLDKEWLAVDNFPGPGYGNVYLAWRNFSLNKAEDGFLLTRSTNDGLTWGPDGGVLVASPASETQPGPPSGNGAFVTVGPDHAVYVFYWDKCFLMRKSTDQGLTFGPAVTVSDLRRQTFDLGIGRFRSPPFFQAAFNPVNGQVYVVYHDNGHGKDKADVFFRQSNDGGMTWGPEVRLNDDSTINAQWSPALAVTPDGDHVAVFWYDRRLDPADNLIDRYGVTGTVVGSSVTFGSNFRVTEESFPPVIGQDPDVGPTYMGDYDQAVADNKYFYTTWGDNRLANPNYAPHVNQPDVRFAKVPVTWNGGAATLSTSSLQPALTETPAGRSNAGTELPSLLGIDLRMTDLGGATLGQTSGNSIWVDDDDSQLYTAADRSERNRAGLLAMLEPDTRHAFGLEHEDKAVTIDPRSAGTQWSGPDSSVFDLAPADWLPITQRLKAASRWKV